MTLLDEVRSDLGRVSADDLVPALRHGQLPAIEQIADVASLSPDVAVAAIRLTDSREFFVPLVHDRSWRRAEPGDGVSMAALDAPAPIVVEHLNPLPAVATGRERAIDVDMTNDVRVIDDSIVVKWQFLRQPGSLIGPRVAAHLSAAGFRDMPEPFATVTWRDELLVSFARFLPGAEDGWEWMLDDVRRMLAGEAPAPSWPEVVGQLAARMHAAAVHPTQLIDHPVERRSLAPIAQHYRALLDSTLDAELRVAVERWRSGFMDACDTLTAADDVDVIPIHGDLHPGQFLRWRDGVAICDFDGNPTLPAHLRTLRGPTAQDVAGILRGFDHVAIAAARRTGESAALGPAREWARDARGSALTAYRREPGVCALDESVLGALETLSPLHEAVYATTYLPRWRYVPLAVLDGGW